MIEKFSAKTEEVKRPEQEEILELVPDEIEEGSRVQLKDGRLLEVTAVVIKPERFCDVIDVAHPNNPPFSISERELLAGIVLSGGSGTIEEAIERDANTLITSIWDSGFKKGELVYFEDEAGEKREGDIMYDAFDTDGNPFVGIEVEVIATDLDGKPILKNGLPQLATYTKTVKLDDFLRMNPPRKRKALKEIGSAIS